MRKKIIIIFCVFIPLLCFSCSTQLCLQKRTNRLIGKSHKNVDTVYLYSVAFNNFNLVWYHKDNFIHSFLVRPYRTKQYKSIEARNITISNDSINKYFERSLYKGIECFENVLDGAWIVLYVKEKNNVMSSSIDTQCLFSNKYSVNSFPYKLQYDFSIVLKQLYIDFGFDFEKMYSVQKTP